jgi:hypothetical protein
MIKMRQWRIQLLNSILEELDNGPDILRYNTVVRFDIGIFPWHGYIELSYQCADEKNMSDRVADWRLYNFTNVQERKWISALPLQEIMKKTWEADASTAEDFFMAAGEVAKDGLLLSKLISLFPNQEIEITVFNPDDRRSKNYAL